MIKVTLQYNGESIIYQLWKLWPRPVSRKLSFLTLHPRTSIDLRRKGDMSSWCRRRRKSSKKSVLEKVLPTTETMRWPLPPNVRFYFTVFVTFYIDNLMRFLINFSTILRLAGTNQYPVLACVKVISFAQRLNTIVHAYHSSYFLPGLLQDLDTVFNWIIILCLRHL